MSTDFADLQQNRRFRRCVLHIGTEKTGSKSIQCHLKAERDTHLEQGVLYPTCLGVHQASQWDLVAAVHPNPWKHDIGRWFAIADPEDQRGFVERLRSDLEREFDAHPTAETLLISSEHFHSRLNTPQMIGALKRFLQDWADTFEIIVYFRRQDRVAVSYQSTCLKSSVHLSKRQLAGIGLGPDTYYTYDKIYQNWASIFGETAIHARLFDEQELEGGNVLSDFCQLVGLPDPEANSEPVNRSLDTKAFHFLQTLNGMYPITPGDRSDEARAAMVREISNAFAGHHHTMTRQQAEVFYAKYAEGNERLRTIAFPNRSKPLFDNDFSDYPETIEDDAPRYEDAVEIALHLWRQIYPTQFKENRLTKIKRWISKRASAL